LTITVTCVTGGLAHLGRQDLDGDRPVQARVERLVHLAHSARDHRREDLAGPRRVPGLRLTGPSPAPAASAATSTPARRAPDAFRTPASERVPLVEQLHGRHAGQLRELEQAAVRRPLGRLGLDHRLVAGQLPPDRRVSRPIDPAANRKASGKPVMSILQIAERWTPPPAAVSPSPSAPRRARAARRGRRATAAARTGCCSAGRAGHGLPGPSRQAATRPGPAQTRSSPDAPALWPIGP